MNFDELLKIPTAPPYASFNFLLYVEKTVERERYGEERGNDRGRGGGRGRGHTEGAGIIPAECMCVVFARVRKCVCARARCCHPPSRPPSPNPPSFAYSSRAGLAYSSASRSAATVATSASSSIRVSSAAMSTCLRDIDREGRGGAKREREKED